MKPETSNDADAGETLDTTLHEALTPFCHVTLRHAHLENETHVCITSKERKINQARALALTSMFRIVPTPAITGRICNGSTTSRLGNQNNPPSSNPGNLGTYAVRADSCKAQLATRQDIEMQKEHIQVSAVHKFFHAKEN